MSLLGNPFDSSELNSDHMKSFMTEKKARSPVICKYHRRSPRKEDDMTSERKPKLKIKSPEKNSPTQIKEKNKSKTP